MKVKDLQQYVRSRAQLIERALEEYLPGDDVVPEILHRSMRYSTWEGKRLRGIWPLPRPRLPRVRAMRPCP